jgi:hypothetical protein
MRGDKAVEICAVSYDVLWTDNGPSQVYIDKDTYKDYFKVGSKNVAIPKA